MSLLDQDITKKEWVNKLLEWEPKQELDAEVDKGYQVEVICNSEVYAKEAKDPLPGLYYIVFWKGYKEYNSI